MLAAEKDMADSERKTIPFQIRCSPSWKELLEQAAEKLGISAASYIRLAASERLARDGFVVGPAPAKKRKPKGD